MDDNVPNLYNAAAIAALNSVKAAPGNIWSAAKSIGSDAVGMGKAAIEGVANFTRNLAGSFLSAETPASTPTTGAGSTWEAPSMPSVPAGMLSAGRASAISNSAMARMRNGPNSKENPDFSADTGARDRTLAQLKSVGAPVQTGAQMTEGQRLLARAADNTKYESGFRQPNTTFVDASVSRSGGNEIAARQEERFAAFGAGAVSMQDQNAMSQRQRVQLAGNAAVDREML